MTTMMGCFNRETEPQSPPVAASGFWASRAVHAKQEKLAEPKPEIDEVLMVSMKRRAKKCKAKAEVGNDVRWDLMATVMLELSIANGGAPMPGEKEEPAAETALRSLKKKNHTDQKKGNFSDEPEDSTSAGDTTEFSDASSDNGWDFLDARESLPETKAKKTATKNKNKKTVTKDFACYYKRGLLLSMRPRPTTTPPGSVAQGLHARYTTPAEEACLAPLGVQKAEEQESNATKPTGKESILKEMLKKAPWRMARGSDSSQESTPAVKPPPGLAPPPGLF